jgi:hypothetical protein
VHPFSYILLAHVPSLKKRMSKREEALHMQKPGAKFMLLTYPIAALCNFLRSVLTAQWMFDLVQ